MDLKPCPFCGSNVTLTKVIGVNALYAVYCSNENCYIQPSTKVCKSREEAIDAWNRRAE